MMEAQRSSETSVLTRTTRRNVREDGILQFKDGFEVMITRIFIAMIIKQPKRKM
jgi:hypothetical protein